MTIYKKNKCPDFYPCMDGTFTTKQGKGVCSFHGGMLIQGKAPKKVKPTKPSRDSPVQKPDHKTTEFEMMLARIGNDGKIEVAYSDELVSANKLKLNTKIVVFNHDKVLSKNTPFLIGNFKNWFDFDDGIVTYTLPNPPHPFPIEKVENIGRVFLLVDEKPTEKLVKVKQATYLQEIREYDALPGNVKSIIDSLNEDADPYQEAKRMIDELEKINWTADFGLSGELVDIEPLKQKPVMAEEKDNFSIMLDKARKLTEIINEKIEEGQKGNEFWHLHRERYTFRLPSTRKAKYIKIDSGTSAKYMLDTTDGRVYGTKGYGTINRGHRYGLIEDYLNGTKIFKPFKEFGSYMNPLQHIERKKTKSTPVTQVIKLSKPEPVKASKITEAIKQAVNEDVADYTNKGVLIGDAVDRWIKNIEEDIEKGRIKLKDIPDYKAGIKYAKTLKLRVYKTGTIKKEVPFYEQKFTPDQQKEMIELGAKVEQIIKNEGEPEQKAFLKNPEFLKNYLGYVRFKVYPEEEAKQKEFEEKTSFVYNAHYGMFSSIPIWLMKKLAAQWVRMKIPEAKRVTAGNPDYYYFSVKLTFDEKMKSEMIQKNEEGYDKDTEKSKKINQEVKDIIWLFNKGYWDRYSDYGYKFRFSDQIYFIYKNFDKISGIEDIKTYEDIKNNYMQSF